MSSDRFKHMDISHPVLTSATSSRVNPVGKDGVYSSTEDLLKRQQTLKNQNPVEGKQNTQTSAEEAVQRLETKYASPENLIVSTMNTLSIANIEAHHAVRSNGGGGSSAFSDTSSDISDATTSLPSATSGSTFVLPVVQGISDDDISQVEMFYRSRKTDIRVCRCLANLYFSAPKTQTLKPPGSTEELSSNKKRSSIKSKKSKSESDAPPPKSPDPSDISKDEWEFSKTGIPLLLLNTGEHVRERELQFVLAEKGTGFTLWKESINHLTVYSTPHTNFHTITLAQDCTRLVGFSFDDAEASTEFAEAYRSLTGNPEDNLLNLSKKKKKKEKKSKPKYKAPRKVDISQPCCFVHVTKLERPNLVNSMFPPPPSGAELCEMGITRALSQSSGISECSTTPSEH